jgi:hypothetical protein
MKHAIITAIAIIILHLGGFSQLFDATIDGAVPGNVNDPDGLYHEIRT